MKYTPVYPARSSGSESSSRSTSTIVCWSRFGSAQMLHISPCFNLSTVRKHRGHIDVLSRNVLIRLASESSSACGRCFRKNTYFAAVLGPTSGNAVSASTKSFIAWGNQVDMDGQQQIDIIANQR